MTYKTNSYHVSNLGKFAPREIADKDGFVLYHDSPEYERMDLAELIKASTHRVKIIRNAAITEIATRKLQAWRESER